MKPEGTMPKRQTSEANTTSRTGARAAAAGRAESLAGAPALRRAIAVLLFAALTAVGARVAIPLPGTPVPFTFQVLTVLLAGFLLGPRLGAASQGAYLLAGISGLPVFAAGGGLPYLLGPTGGYLLAYPAAAALVGWLAWRSSPSLVKDVAGLVAGVAVIHAGGVTWLSAMAGHEAALALGVVPFLAVDGLKAFFVLLVGRRLRRRARRVLRVSN